jgi:Predicted AAA-ATPase
MAEKELPIGIQDFGEIIDGNYVYVDKTPYHHRLISKLEILFSISSPPIWEVALDQHAQGDL